MEIEYPWLRNRGYPHVTPQLNLIKDRDKILAIVKNQKYVARHAFFPLIHAVINERRYKRINSNDNKRAHSFLLESGEVKKNVKQRPLHYASHFDAIIFGYYADILIKKYEHVLDAVPGLSDCVTAYRKRPIVGIDKNKSTIHFAHEAFEEIRNRSVTGCEVLKFDIKSFFSRIDHKMLKRAWADLLNKTELPKDHYNVFKAATKFSYILKDDLRIKSNSGGKRAGFDERKLSQIRKTGKISFFGSNQEFRNAIANSQLRLHRFPFRNHEGMPVGIPQGLPISAALANLYLLEFDLDLLQNLVNDMGAYYRRYSDDIIVVCKPDQANFVENYVTKAIQNSKVEMSKDKTERFLFTQSFDGEATTVISTKITNEGKKHGVPFSYLGFEFYGDKILIKSANLAKFYRRMIRSVKTKAKRALTIARTNPQLPIVIYRRQLYKLYTKYPLGSSKIKSNFKRLVKHENGNYYFKVVKGHKPHTSNYLSYIHRASEIMGQPSIELQIRNHKRIFNQAIHKNLNRAFKRSRF